MPLLQESLLFAGFLRKTMTPTLPIEPDEMRLVLLRYKAHHAMYSYEELTRLGINPEFVFALLEVFEDQESFNQIKFDRFRLEVIVDYIRKTHEYYLHRKMLEIDQSIHLLLAGYQEAHPLLLILNDAYSAYKTHLSSHIEVEESQFLPYILHLEKVADGKASFQAYPSSYSLERFLVHHHDTEKDLAEIRAMILHYSPPPTSETLHRILLSQLQVFEKDLAIHALIEDDVLIPRAMALERQWGR